MEIRQCLLCEREMPADRRIDSVWCSALCGNRARARRHYKDNPLYYSKKRLKENSDVQKRIYSRVKCRAKKRGIPFDIELLDIQVPEVCPVLGLDIFSVPGLGTNQSNSPSVDRIVPELGYTKGNVRVISMRANLLKSNATIEELESVVSDLKAVLS